MCGMSGDKTNGFKLVKISGFKFVKRSSQSDEFHKIHIDCSIHSKIRSNKQFRADLDSCVSCPTAMPNARLFGSPNARRTMHATLHAAAADVAEVAASPERICHCVRDVLYRDDSRWVATAQDPDYIRIFPERWWPAELWRRATTSASAEPPVP